MGKQPRDYWVSEAENILKEVRQGLHRSENARFVGNGVRDGVTGGTRSVFWHKAIRNKKGVLKIEKVDRTAVGAMFALISSLTNEDVIRRANHLWTNGDYVKAILSYAGDALKNTGLGWMSTSAMIFIEEMVLDKMFKEGYGGVCFPIDFSSFTNPVCAQTYAKAGIAGFFATLMIDLVLYIGGQNNKNNPLRFSNVMKSGILASVNAIFGYVCTSITLIGWQQLIASMLLVWVLQQIIDGVYEAGLVGYIKSWMPKFLTGTKEWKYDDNLKIPEDMCCPITQEPFVDPVSCGDYLYERADIEKWIINTGTHPIARETKVSLWSLKPCHSMRSLVERYMQENDGFLDYA